jgi:hypothetical protein
VNLEVDVPASKGRSYTLSVRFALAGLVAGLGVAAFIAGLLHFDKNQAQPALLVASAFFCFVNGLYLIFMTNQVRRIGSRSLATSQRFLLGFSPAVFLMQGGTLLAALFTTRSLAPSALISLFCSIFGFSGCGGWFVIAWAQAATKVRPPLP